MLLSKMISNIRHPWNYINYLNTTPFQKYLPDKLVVCCAYRELFGRKLNLKDPRTFNEKLQWLKIYNRNPEYCKLVDKYTVKEIVAKKIGGEHVIPTYGVWNNERDIGFEKLPDQFVLKTTHDSHSVFICKDKKELDIEKVKKDLAQSLHNNYYYFGREWPYKNVKPRIIAEKLISDDEKGVTDYKIHCFNGEPKFILACANRFSNTGLQEVFYDLSWKKMQVSRPQSCTEKVDIEKPDCLDEMLKISEILSKDIPFVRIDLYQVENKIYFGEMTFFPASGYKHFIPDEYDLIFGEYMHDIGI